MSTKYKYSDQPSFQILICLIQIWTPEDPKKPMDIPANVKLMSEVESIEINETYKQLIDSASVKFPRGTIIRKTGTPDKIDDNTYKVSVNINDAGVIEETRNDISSVAAPSDFNIRDRIRIYLGYTDDPKVAAMAKIKPGVKNIYSDKSIYDEYMNTKYLLGQALNLMFDGYITKVSVEAPIELHCENLASPLKDITCPKIVISSKATVNDLLADTSKYKLLEGTGLKLYPASQQQQFDLGRIELDDNLSIADVLTEWAKYGIYSFIINKPGQSYIAVGRSYFDNASKDAIMSLVEQPSNGIEILFDYNVASNGLNLVSTDKTYIAVEAEGVDKDDHILHVTVQKNPKYATTGEGDKYLVSNKTSLSKKSMKLGIGVLKKSTSKTDLKNYTVVSYHARKIPITEEQLLEEAIKYMENYNKNGIEGSLTLFGDLHLHTGTKVHLQDNRYPAKNGYYFVEEVNTAFGTGGYRQTIKLPYCIKRDSSENK